MKNMRDGCLLGLIALVGVLASSCAAEVRSTVEQPVAVEQPIYLAQAPVADCRPGDSSMVCCIKKFPLTPVESCGATAEEAAEVLKGIKVLHEASTQDEHPTADGQDADEFAHNAHLPEWKQRCIRGYNQCQDDGWTGSCYDCLRRCEGQHEWPTSMCGPRERRPGK